MRSVRVEDPDETWLSRGDGRLGGPGSPPGENDRGRLRRAERRADAGASGNARLTAANAAVLLVLLAAEGVTILRVRQLLSPHVFIGVVLIPPVLVKVGSTTWRFARYYTGAPAYRRKGPPPVLLRLLGPVVVILTLVLLFSGVGLLLVSRPWLPLLLKVHEAKLRAVVRRDDHSRARPRGRGVPAGPAGLAAPDPARGDRGRYAAVADRGQPGGRRHALGFLLLSQVGHWLSAAPGAGQ